MNLALLVGGVFQQATHAVQHLEIPAILTMPYFTTLIILASLIGAGFSTLSWWVHMASKPKPASLTRAKIGAMFALAAMPAPFFALGGYDLITKQFPWTKDTPHLALLASFVAGVASQSLVPQLTKKLVAKVAEEKL